MDRLPGFRDFYPEPLPHPDVWSADARNYIFDKWRTVRRGATAFANTMARRSEPEKRLELFTTKSGEEIVGQLYNFSDKGDRSIALRPENGSPRSLAWSRRMSAITRSRSSGSRSRNCSATNASRRAASGNIFNSAPRTIFGESDVAADAELIALLIDTLRSFGLTASDFVIRLLAAATPWGRVFNQLIASLAAEAYRVSCQTRSFGKLEREQPARKASEKLASLGILPRRSKCVHQISGANRRTRRRPLKSRRSWLERVRQN